IAPAILATLAKWGATDQPRPARGFRLGSLGDAELGGESPLEQPRTEPLGVPPGPALHPKDPRSTIELVKDIAADTSSLVRKEVELAKQELGEAATAPLKAA